MVLNNRVKLEQMQDPSCINYMPWKISYYPMSGVISWKRIDKVNQLLQTVGLDLKVVSEHFVSLINYITVIRNAFDSYEAETIETRTILPARADDPKLGDSSNCSFYARDDKP